MTIEQTLNDLELLDVLRMVSSNRESGRLQMTDGSTRGAFFFRKGRLVDARVGPFSGFVAVNLAISMGRVGQLNFDPSISPPTSCFKVLDERNTLRERFGIETEGPETTDDLGAVNETAVQACILSQEPVLAEEPLQWTTVAAVSEKIEETATDMEDVVTTKDLSLPAAVPFLEQQVAPSQGNIGLLRRKSAFFSSPLRVLPSSLTQTARITLVVGAGLLLSIVVPAAIVLAAHWSGGKAVAPQTELRPENASATPAPVAVSITAQTDDRAIVQKPASDLMRRNARPSTPNSATSLKDKSKTLLSDDRPQKNTAAVASSTTEREIRSAAPPTRPSARTIAVVVQIDEGRVTEAYIPAHQPGLGAYEATALRLARQRRYGKDTRKKETITLQVTSEP